MKFLPFSTYFSSFPVTLKSVSRAKIWTFAELFPLPLISSKSLEVGPGPFLTSYAESWCHFVTPPNSYVEPKPPGISLCDHYLERGLLFYYFYLF